MFSWLSFKLLYEKQKTFQPPVAFYWKSVFLLILQINSETSASDAPAGIHLLHAWGLQRYEKRDSGAGVFQVTPWNV